jgi:hypothetical protein
MRLSSRICFVALLVVVLVGGPEGLARGYWRLARHVGRTDAETLFRTEYREVAASGLDEAPADGRSFDVLLLGGSVLHPTCGDIAERLQRRLQEKLGRPVRVFNFSYSGRTSGDSRMKYERIHGRRFDLVLLYHGINDAFLNNCPPGVFRADYTHVPYIAQMKALEHHPEVGWFALPYTVEFVAINLADRWGLSRGPRHVWSGYAADLRTPPAFEANLEAVADLAQRRGDRLMLATYAYHLPPDYSDEAFRAKRLDYDKHSCPAGTWGQPVHLTRALEAHNAAARRVAQRRGTLFVDVAGQLPRSRLCFDDPCHLNAEGCRRFVELVVAALDAPTPTPSPSTVNPLQER